MSIFRKITSIKKSIIFSWLLYYAIILIIPIVISVFTYVKTAKVVENEINSSNMLFLKRIQQQMDFILNDARRLSMEISLNTSVNNLLSIKDMKESKISSYDIYRTVRELSSYKIPNSSISDFYVYFKDLDYIVSPDTGNNSKDYYEIYFNKKNVSYDDWKTTLSGIYKGDFIILDNSFSQDNSKKTIIYVKTIPYINQGKTSANIVMNLDGSKFMEAAQDISSLNEGKLFILNKNNNVVISSEENYDTAYLDYNDMIEKSGMIHRKVNGYNEVISYISSGTADWKYISILPGTIFWEKYDYIRKLTIIGITFCLVIGAFIIGISLKKNYNPVKRLISALEIRNGQAFDKKNDEFSFIEDAIHKVYLEKEKSESILNQQNKVLRANFISRLLKGGISGKLPLEDLFKMYNMEFVSQYFGVMIFYLEDFNEKLISNTDENEKLSIIENFKFAQAKMIETIGQIVNTKNQAFITEIDDMLVCLVNFKDRESASMKNDLTKEVLEAYDILREKYNINFTVTVSDIHETTAGIPDAYNEAVEAMEYKRMLDINEVIHYEDIKEVQKGRYYYPLEIEQQLINSIKVGDFEKSKSIINDIFVNNFEKSVLSIKISRCLMFDLVSTMIKLANELNSDEDDAFLEEFNPIDRLLNCESIVQMKSEMLQILNTFSNYITERNKKMIKSRIKKDDINLKNNVIEYVSRNYADYNLGITGIADCFGIHPINLSKLFLEQTGETLLDFINKTRICEAKKLFGGSYNNLDEISNKVGYSSVRTFTRAFKKFEGVTPGKYKDAISIEIADDSTL